jgi:hypothetical protein
MTITSVEIYVGGLPVIRKKPFEYKSTDVGATIQIEGTEGSDGRDSVRIEIKMKK